MQQTAMERHWLLAVVLLLCASTLVRSEVTIKNVTAPTTQVTGQVNIPSKYASSEGGRKAAILAQVKILLSGVPSFDVLTTSDGSFTVEEVPEGTYMLQVVHPQLKFDPVFIDVQAKGGGASGLKVNAHLLDFAYGKGLKLKYPLGLAPSEVFAYFEKREEFNILSVLKNPMVLMGVVSFGAMFLMPKADKKAAGGERDMDEVDDDQDSGGDRPKIEEVDSKERPTVSSSNQRQGGGGSKRR